MEKIKKLSLLLIIPIMIFTFSGCSSNELSGKLVADTVVISNDKLSLITDSSGETKVYNADYTNFSEACNQVTVKYGYKPFVAHSKQIIISTETQIKNLKDYIWEIKNYYQISPNMKIYLAEDNVISMILNGEIKSENINKALENQDSCVCKISNYDNIWCDNEFAVLYENDDTLLVKTMTL